MNINPTYPNFPMANHTPTTESLRRDNVMREVIVQPSEVQKPAAEKGAASDFDKVKTPGQQNEHANAADNQKRAVQDRTSIGERGQQGQDGQQKEGREQGEESQKRGSGGEVTRVEQQQIKELKLRDSEVRAHEAAHATTAGVHGGSPNFTYQTGPDGKRYAVGGEVSVDLSRVAGDPRATIRKMQQVHAAALAPVNPSTQDMQVASTAMRIMAQAQQDLAKITLDPEASIDKSRFGDVRSASLDKIDADETDNEHGEPTTAQLKEEEDAVEQAVFSSGSQQSESVIRRSLRIQNFYMNINYTSSGSYQVSA